MVATVSLPKTHLAGEHLLSFSDAVKTLPTVNSRRHAPSTLYRWARKGIGGVRLEYLRIGRSMVTSREALDRFFAQLAAADERAAAEFVAAGEGAGRG
jgi:hypothetical protein